MSQNSQNKLQHTAHVFLKLLFGSTFFLLLLILNFDIFKNVNVCVFLNVNSDKFYKSLACISSVEKGIIIVQEEDVDVVRKRRLFQESLEATIQRSQIINNCKKIF